MQIFMQIENPCGGLPPLQMSQTSHLNVLDLVCVMAHIEQVFLKLQTVTHQR